MILTEKWFLYAVSAAILWGISYAASGPILREGFPPLLFYFCYSLFSLLLAAVILVAQGKMNTALKQFAHLGPHWGWFLLSLFTASLGALMTYLAIGGKNPTLTSLIEISYPLFVLLFTWLFFREVPLNIMAALGALLVLSGVALILLSEH